MSTRAQRKVEKHKSLVSRQVKRIAPSGIRKFFDLLASMEGVISLGVGEPDFVTPWHIREAAITSLEKGYTMYTSNLGMPELRQELSRYLENVTDLIVQVILFPLIGIAYAVLFLFLTQPLQFATAPSPCHSV